MNKDDILKDFDTLAEAKRKGAVNLKLCLGFALVVVVLVLAWGLVVNFTFFREERETMSPFLSL